MSRKRNSFVNLILAIIVILVALQVIKVVFHIGIGLFKMFLPLIIIGFAVYGFMQFVKRR